jgi:hypothetical protein
LAPVLKASAPKARSIGASRRSRGRPRLDELAAASEASSGTVALTQPTTNGLYLELRKALDGKTPARCSSVEDMFEKLVPELMGPVPRAVCSRAAEGRILDICTVQVGTAFTECAATAFLCTRYSLDETARRLQGHIAEGHLKVVCGLTQTIFDETGLILRAARESKNSFGRRARTFQGAAQVVKVMQTEATFAVLVCDRAGKETLLAFRMIVPLQCMDHSTGECTVACVSETWDDPAVATLMSLCPRIVHLTTSDRAGGNERSERYYRQHMDLNVESRLRTTCAVHRSHTCQTHQFDLVNPVISGLLQTGLAMRSGGALDALRRSADLYLQARMVVRWGLYPPGPNSPQTQQREAILQLFLGPHRGVSGANQGFVLRKFLNGDWSTPSVVPHYCQPGCCPEGTDREEHKQEIREHVVDALLPFSMPTLSRSRWVGAPEAVDFGGLLYSVNTMFAEVVPVWIRELSNPNKPVTLADFDGGRLTENDTRVRGLRFFDGCGAAAHCERGDEEAEVWECSENAQT